MEKISILAVLYGKELSESVTLNSLIKYDFHFHSLSIYNNGPNIIKRDINILNDLNMRFSNVEIIDDLSNSPLSKIYNNFLLDRASDYYVILDDDTELNFQYLYLLQDEYKKKQYDLIIPKIISIRNIQYYPVSCGEVIRTEGDISHLNNILSIASGTIINSTLLRLFITKKILGSASVFDERYALYGVDTSFFKKISRLQKENRLNIALLTSLTHSLSRVESTDNSFRRRERLFDLVISTRCYPSIKNYFYFSKNIMKLLIRFDIRLLHECIKVFFKAKHPRC